MKSIAGLVLALWVSPAFASGGFVQFPSEARAREVSATIGTSPQVAPYLATAKAMYAPDAETVPLLIFSQEAGSGLDCDQPMATYGEVNDNFCAFTASLAYGWYADPVLVVVVKGYMNRNVVASGAVSRADLKITEVSIQSPLPTGLE